MSGMKEKKKERHRMSFIKKIKSSEEKFGIESSVDETAVCVRDFTITVKGIIKRIFFLYSLLLQEKKLNFISFFFIKLGILRITF